MMSSLPSSSTDETTGGGVTAMGAIVGAPRRAEVNVRVGAREAAKGCGLTRGAGCDAADRPSFGAYQHFWCAFLSR